MGYGLWTNFLTCLWSEIIYLCSFMKKIIIGITALLYLILSSGFVMEVHYCMGKISGVELFASTSEKCQKCGMKAKKGCCKDELKIFKLKDSHKNVTNDLAFNTSDMVLPLSYATSNADVPVQKISLALQNHSPPDISTASLDVLHCVFRI